MKFKSQKALNTYLKGLVNPENSMYYGKNLNEANKLAENPQLVKMEEDREQLQRTLSIVPHLSQGLQEQINFLDNQINSILGEDSGYLMVASNDTGNPLYDDLADELAQTELPLPIDGLRFHKGENGEIRYSGMLPKDDYQDDGEFAYGEGCFGVVGNIRSEEDIPFVLEDLKISLAKDIKAYAGTGEYRYKDETVKKLAESGLSDDIHFLMASPEYDYNDNTRHSDETCHQEILAHRAEQKELSKKLEAFKDTGIGIDESDVCKLVDGEGIYHQSSNPEFKYNGRAYDDRGIAFINWSDDLGCFIRKDRTGAIVESIKPDGVYDRTGRKTLPFVA